MNAIFKLPSSVIYYRLCDICSSLHDNNITYLLNYLYDYN